MSDKHVERVIDEDEGLFRQHDGSTESPRHDVGGALNEYLTEAHERDDALEAGAVTSADPHDDHEIVVEMGSEVVCADGHKLGEVVDIRDDIIVVEKGSLVPEDVFVPVSAIVDADEHHLTINVTKAVATHCGWDVDPDDDLESEKQTVI